VKEPKRKELDSNKESASKATVKEIMAYFKANKKTFLSLNFGIAFMSLASYAGMYWVPAFLSRVHGWEDQRAGLTFGIIVSIFATLGVLTGGRYADYLSKKGVLNGKMKAACIGMSVAVLCTIGVLLPDPNIALVFVALFCFFAAFPYGSATAAIQEIAPNNMRAIFSAFFLFVVNIIGLGLGPLSVGVLNDLVFHDPLKIHQSIFITQFTGSLISAALLYIGLKPFTKSVAYLKLHLTQA
jgi:MFS family permease